MKSTIKNKLLEENIYSINDNQQLNESDMSNCSQINEESNLADNIIYYSKLSFVSKLLFIWVYSIFNVSLYEFNIFRLLI